MNILYLADPNSIHDLKWISFFSVKRGFKTFILPRIDHYKYYIKKRQPIDIEILDPIHDFSILRFYRTFHDAWRIIRILRRKKIDLIHILYAEPNALWCLFKKYFRVPIIISCRGTDVLKTIPDAFREKTLINYIVAPAYKAAFLKADVVTGTSRNQLESIRRFSGRTNKMELVRTGIELPQEKYTGAFPDELGDKPYILFPRYIKPIYNHELCLEAITLLPEKIKISHAMVFIGKNSGDLQYQNKLEKIIRGIPDAHIIFLPKQKQALFHELIKRSSLIVMTPRSDGTSVTAMEAMYYKKPLIVGPNEYDEDVFNKLVTKLADWSADELANKISFIINDRIKSIEYPMINIDLATNMNILNRIYTIIN